MNSDGESPSLAGGEFLLRLLHHPQCPDRAVASMGPTVRSGSVQSIGHDQLGGPRGHGLNPSPPPLSDSFRNLGLYHRDDPRVETNALFADSSKTHQGNADREFIRFSDNFYNSPNLTNEGNSLVLNGYEANYQNSMNYSSEGSDSFRSANQYGNSSNLNNGGNNRVSNGYEANYRNSLNYGSEGSDSIRRANQYGNSSNLNNGGNNRVSNGYEASYGNSSNLTSEGSSLVLNGANYQNPLNYSSEVGSDGIRRVNGFGNSLNLNNGGSNRVSNGYECSYGNSPNLGRIGDGYVRPSRVLNRLESEYRNSPNLSRIGGGYDRPNSVLNGIEVDFRNSTNLSRIREGYDRPNRALNGFESNFRNSPDSSRIGEGFRALNGFDPDFPKFPNYGQSQGNISRTGIARQEIKHAPPGFLNKVNNRIGGNNTESSSNGSRSWGIKYEDEREKGVPPMRSAIHSVPGCKIEESLPELPKIKGENGEKLEDFSVPEIFPGDSNDLDAQVSSSIDEENGSSEKNQKRREDYRFNARGQRVLAQWMRKNKRMIQCRNDIDMFNAPLLAIFDSLVPPEEEKMKQQQLLAFLEKLVVKEWPEARLLVYGSCANSFGVKNSDIDICLAMKDRNVNKPEILLKLADILIEENLENVQALTGARVPVVKLMDPVTQMSCDICCNNVLAVVNSKLLRDYAKIDGRLRQLAFIVKHWAKLRGVNETYHGTLSSYAYVLMCIHFLQQCRPAILPCLQKMDITYKAVVDNVECAFFDQVEKLAGFGLRNKENIGQLVWGFFRYWAYCHDYTHDVISVREGSIISKQAKDWTRRVGNDRHLICIEDPFEITHDLGRVVDKFSIKVLREEFERAAQILQFDPNPCVTLFEPYVDAIL